MLEFATNGLAYWRKEELVQAFIGNHGGNSEQTFAVLKAFRSAGEESLESFFGEVLEKLRNGVMRLIIFLEGSSYELRAQVPLAIQRGSIAGVREQGGECIFPRYHPR
jgi:hypothetical protein